MNFKKYLNKRIQPVHLFFLIMILSLNIQAQELYRLPKNTKSRWSSFENRNAEKGKGGIENKGGKGHPFESIKAGGTVTLLDFTGSGTVRRIWLTVSDRTPEMLRSLRIDMYWDKEDKAAVSAPLGDFFGIGLGKRVPFENELFADPEGRSFLCFIPMPFKEAAKITITNDSDKDIKAIFYDINFTTENNDSEELLYFHAYWNRQVETKLAEDFQILPKIKGKGRFLGTNIGVVTNEMYRNTWFGEGEVKIYLDGDTNIPTLVGTGTEDYVGTAYGQGEYSHRYQGSPISNLDKGEFAFYRYHIPDPIYFYKNIRVNLQQIGGAPQDTVRLLLREGAKLQPITIDSEDKFYRLLGVDDSINFNNKNIPQGWTNFYRTDDVSATAYFYLNKPKNDLPNLGSLELRTKNLIDLK